MDENQKRCEDKIREFYDRSMKTWLQNNDIEIYSAHNEGKSIVAARILER